MESAHLAEIVYLFVDGQVAAELTFEEYETHIDRQTVLPGTPPRACVCRAGYVAVGPGLRIQGLVFFLLQVDDLGRPDKNFNVPLPYLAKNAGPGPDFGFGPVPMACRGSCSVPWQANNLWDPTREGTANPLDALVAAVAANRLELDPQPLPDVNPAPESAPDLRALIDELSARHTRQLMDLQDQHEGELAAQRELMDAKVELYRQEVTRLRTELAVLQSPSDRRTGASG